MKNTTQLLAIILIVLFVSCNVEKKNSTPQIFHIDLDKGSDPEQIEEFLSNMEIHLLPMETTESSYFAGSSSHLHITDDYLFVADNMQNIILRYDRQGKYINTINRKGQGGEEYTAFLSLSIVNPLLYIGDWKKIQVYDYEGNYVKTIPMEHERPQLHIKPDGTILVARDFHYPTQLLVCNQKGQTIAEYFPTPEIVRTFTVPKVNYYSMGDYDGGCYITNYLDNTVYLVKDTVHVLATMDFGPKNIPSDFFDGTTEEVERKFWELRGAPDKATKNILDIDNVIVTDDWITFIPMSFEPTVVYCNRKKNTVIVNKGLKEPYHTLLGGYQAPNDFDEKEGKFYRLVSNMDLKEMIETLAAEDKDYLTKYPFLQGINPKEMKENDNDWVLSFKMK